MDDDTKALFTRILEVVEGTRADVRALGDRVGRLENEFVEFRHGTEMIFSEMRGEFKAVNARLDEQRQTVNALIPTRIAAVPSSAA